MKPRILFLCTTSPFGKVSGAGLRTRNIARLLGDIGPVTMVAATERPWSEEQLRLTREEFNLAAYFEYVKDPIKGIGERFNQLTNPRFLKTNAVRIRPEDHAVFDGLLKNHDLVWIHTLKLANGFQRYRWENSIIDIDDYPSRFHWTASAFATSPKEKLRRMKNTFLWRRREADWRNRFTLLTVCKEQDRAHFGNGERVHVVPNGFSEMPRPVAPPAQSRQIGMIGDFNYLPNADGIRWFAETVLPGLRKKHPGIQVRLIGRNSDAIARSLNLQEISGLGYVDDPALEIAGWSSMIIPTRLGGGTHLKLAEGLARGVPIVSTSHGTRGYSVTSGEHLLVAETSGEFEQACSRILNDESLAQTLVDNAYRLFQKNYSWQSIAPNVQKAVDDCLRLSRRN